MRSQDAVIAEAWEHRTSVTQLALEQRSQQVAVAQLRTRRSTDATTTDTRDAVFDTNSFGVCVNGGGSR